MPGITMTTEDLERIVLVAMHLGAKESPVTASRPYIEEKLKKMLGDPSMAWSVLDLPKRGRLRDWLAHWDKNGEVFKLEQVF